MKTETRIKVLVKCYLKAKSNGSSPDILQGMRNDIWDLLEDLKDEDPAAHLRITSTYMEDL